MILASGLRAGIAIVRYMRTLLLDESSKTLYNTESVVRCWKTLYKGRLWGVGSEGYLMELN